MSRAVSLEATCVLVKLITAQLNPAPASSIPAWPYDPRPRRIEDMQKSLNVNVNGALICGPNYMTDELLTSREKFTFFIAAIRGSD
jgi:hypothetical protein